MGVVIVQSKPVAQVYRLFATLISLLLVMAIAFSVAKWRAAQPEGSPYGGLAAVATGTAPIVAAPAHVAAIQVPPAQVTSAQVAARVTPAPAPVAMASESTAPPVPSPAPMATSPTPPAAIPIVTADVAAPAASPVSDAARMAPRVIALEKSNPGADPLPAPAAAVAAAAAAQHAARVAPPPVAAPVHAGTDVADATPKAAADAESAAAAGGMININTASVETLNNLPGGGRIGKTIVRHRPYGSIQDLVDHRVLRSSDFARIRTHITTN